MLDSAIAYYSPKDRDFETRKERRDLKPISAKVELRSGCSGNTGLTGRRQRGTTGGVVVDCAEPWRAGAAAGAGAAGRAGGFFAGAPGRGVVAVGLVSTGAPAAVGGGASSDGSTVSF